jgi:hypothetical protein
MAVLLAILACSLGAFPVVQQTCVAISGMCFLVAIAVGIHKIRSRDPYSLTELREMVLEGTYNEADIPELDADADGYCMCCNHVYGAKFKVCPKCGR